MTDRLVPSTRHLTEGERHGIADGTLPDDERPSITRHLAECDACASDVARLGELMTRIHAEPAPAETLDELWPAIRARIEQGKVVPLGAPATRTTTHRSTRRSLRWWLPGGVTAAVAALLIAALLRPARQPVSMPESTAPRNDRTMMTVADSSRAYEQQVAVLLEELELRRSMLPPATAAAIDHDLRLIDGAIAELEEALAHDPNDPALRQLLAASYRQKRDLLRRVDNAS